MIKYLVAIIAVSVMLTAFFWKKSNKISEVEEIMATEEILETEKEALESKISEAAKNDSKSENKKELKNQIQTNDQTQLEKISIDLLNGNDQSLKAYLSNGGDPNALDSDGRPLAMLAGISGDMDSMIELKRYGADFNRPSTDGDSILMATIEASLSEGEHKEVIDFLFEENVDLNFEGRGRLTALHSAIGIDNPLLVKALIEKGAIQKTLKGGVTPLMMAVQNSSNRVIPVLATKEEINRTNNEGQSAIFYSVLADNIDSARQFLKLGADENIKDANGKTVADYARESENDDIASLFLEK